MEYANDSADANKIRALYAANPSQLNIPDSAMDYNAKNCANSSPVDFLYLSTIRGGRKMKGGGGSGDSSSVLSIGGCFTCKKGGANITHIYNTIHIVIPQLYKKYKAAAKAAKKPKKRRI